MPEAQRAATTARGRGTGRTPELVEALTAAVLSLGLLAYMYAIGWALTYVRLAAVHLPVSFALASVGSGGYLAGGVRAVLATAVAFVAMCALAYLVYLGCWDQHAQAWHEIVHGSRRDARERYLRRKPLKRPPPRAPRRRCPQETVVRVIAGFNVGVLAVVAGLVAGRFLKTLIDQWQPGHWWALLGPWAICSIVLARALATINPLRGGRTAHASLWLAGVGVAAISSAPVGLLVLISMAVGTLGRRYGKLSLPRSPSAFLRSPLPWGLLTVFALLAISYAAMPPVTFSQATVQTTEGRLLGGYVGRTGSGVYIATCTPLADATSTEDRVQLLASRAVRSVTSTDVEFTLDTGYRPSLPTLALSALGIDTQTVAWIRPEVKEPRPTCAGTPPPSPSTGFPVPQLGAGVFAGPAPAEGRAEDGEQPVERESPAPTIAALAKRLQPTVLTSITDPFWPVSLGAVLEDVGADGRRTCLRPGPRRPCATGGHATVADLRTQEESAGEFLEYPVRPALTSRPTPQLQALLRGLRGREHPLPPLRAILADPGTLDPWTSAEVYFFYAGRAEHLRWPVPYPAAAEPQLVALEYWFFYPYNYFPTVVEGALMEDAPVQADVANTDLHQGDWEHVVVLFDPRTDRARWLYTARHAGEGRFIPWDSSQLGFEGEHPIVQAAYGGHPSYPAGCGARPRYLKPLNGHVSDWLVCGPGRFAFRASSTPLVDLATTSWACWRGHFGAPSPQAIQRAAQSTNAIARTLARELQSYVYVAGPRSPLWQGENGHLQADDGPRERKPDSGPCLEAGGPAARERAAEGEGVGRQ